MLLLGVWFFVIPLLGIPIEAKKVLLVIPATFLIMKAITRIRKDRIEDDQFSENQEELVREIAEDIADDIVHKADIETYHEMKKLRDIL